MHLDEQNQCHEVQGEGRLCGFRKGLQVELLFLEDDLPFPLSINLLKVESKFLGFGRDRLKEDVDWFF